MVGLSKVPEFFPEDRIDTLIVLAEGNNEYFSHSIWCNRTRIADQVGILFEPVHYDAVGIVAFD